MTPQEALDRIAALCERYAQQDDPGYPYLLPEDGTRFLVGVRAVLAGVEPGVTIDRDALLRVLFEALRGTTVPAVPLADRILALLRPAEGVTLTPSEAALARRWGWHARQWGTHWGDGDTALAARLEAAVTS